MTGRRLGQIIAWLLGAMPLCYPMLPALSLSVPRPWPRGASGVAAARRAARKRRQCQRARRAGRAH